MNTLLLFFALPVAVIIISIALQKILKCPFLVAAIIFAIFLVVTFVIGDLTFLVATIIYTIIAFITAVLTKIICRILREIEDRNCRRCSRRKRCECSNSNNNGTQLLSISGSCSNDNDNGSLLTISSNGCNGTENELLTINTTYTQNNNTGNSCGCGRRR